MDTKPGNNKKTPCKGAFVVRSGLEPELFWTKTRRVANYTIGQSFHQYLGDWAAKIINKFYTQNLF